MEPHRVDFPGMHPEERILLLQRKHWSILAHIVLRYLALAVVPFVVLLVLRFVSVVIAIETENLSGVLLVLGASLYLLLILMMFFHDWLDYYLDVLIVTNERIVRIEQKGLFNRTVSDLTLNRIQDITVELKGLLQTFLRFGSLRIQSAAEHVEFTFKNIPEPEMVKAEILKYARQSEVRPPPPTVSPPTVPPPTVPPATGTPR